jgi:hypothetical protein
MVERGVEGTGDQGSLVLEQRFAIVPEWVIDAGISDCAYRLYSVLLRYGQTSGCRMPARATLAARLHKTCTDTVDRALKELVGVGAVVVEHRRRATGEHLTNRYHLMSTPPGARPTGLDSAPAGGGRIRAATPGRSHAATVAASVRPDPVVPTENTPPPAPHPQASEHGTAGDGQGRPEEDAALLAACAITDLPALAGDCQRLRRGLGKTAARWTEDRLLDALRDAVLVRGYAAPNAGPALRALAADPATHSPPGWPAPARGGTPPPTAPSPS